MVTTHIAEPGASTLGTCTLPAVDARDDLGGRAARFRANVAAIALLAAIERAQRPATPDEHVVLARSSTVGDRAVLDRAVRIEGGTVTAAPELAAVLSLKDQEAARDRERAEIASLRQQAASLARQLDRPWDGVEEYARVLREYVEVKATLADAGMEVTAHVEAVTSVDAGLPLDDQLRGLLDVVAAARVDEDRPGVVAAVAAAVAAPAEPPDPGQPAGTGEEADPTVAASGAGMSNQMRPGLVLAGAVMAPPRTIGSPTGEDEVAPVTPDGVARQRPRWDQAAPTVSPVRPGAAWAAGILEFANLNAGSVSRSAPSALSRSDLPGAQGRSEPRMQLKKSDQAQVWTEAVRRCRLSPEAAAMAREMGMSPRDLIKNIPAPSQPWKAPVEDWVRDLYAARQRRAERRRRHREQPASGETTTDLHPVRE